MSRKGIKNKIGDLARFMLKVKMPNDRKQCWLWVGGKVPKGHGRFWLNGCLIPAGRASLILHGKSEEQGKMACHTCDNPPCVNLGHLFYGTAQQNSDDAKAKERYNFSNLRLSADTVRAIYMTTGSQYSIASRFGVNQSTVSLIKRGKTAAYITRELTPST